MIGEITGIITVVFVCVDPKGIFEEAMRKYSRNCFKELQEESLDAMLEKSQANVLDELHEKS